MTDDEAFSRLALDLDAETEEEADAALAAALQLALREAFDPRESCWPGRDVHDSLRRTCHAAEVLHRLSFDVESAHIVDQALVWLVNLRLPHGLEPAERDRTRLYPSRFKTLAYLGAFDDATVRADFADLLQKENGGMVRGVTESDVLTTCIVLDTLVTLEQAGLRREVCADRRFEAIQGAVRKHFRNWRAVDRSAEPATSGKERAQTSGPLIKIDARELSYAWGLLHDIGLSGVPKTRLNSAVAYLIDAVMGRPSASGGDILQSLYAALQLADHALRVAEVREALNALLRYVRSIYLKPEKMRAWGIGHHTLVMRLIVTRYGDAELARGIAARYLREAKRRRELSENAFNAELKHVIRERLSVELGGIQELSGGHTDAQVYRVPFHYWYPMLGSNNGRHGIHNVMPEASVIVKRSTTDAFATAIANYQQLPDSLREYFVRQPSDAQVYKSGETQTYYLAMEDLTDYQPLSSVLQRLDQRRLSEEHRWSLEQVAATVSGSTFALFRETAVPRASLPGSHIARLYIAPIEAKLLRGVANVPWLKSAAQEFTVNDTRHRELEYYLGIVSRSTSTLQPRQLGMTHGDLHSGNIMLDADYCSAKLIDLDKLSRTGDYLADLGTLLADVCVGRRLAQPDADFGLQPGEIVFPSKDDTGVAENAVRYKPLGREATVHFQKRIFDLTGAFATERHDATWRARFWLACASALLVRLSFEKKKESAAVLYGEAIRLLGELCRHIEQGTSLGTVPFPDVWPQPQKVTADMPEWTHRAPVLRAVHDGIRALGLHAVTDSATITYFTPGENSRTFAKLVPPGREGVGRLLLPSTVYLNGAAKVVKVVHSPHDDDAFGTIVILTELTQTADVLALVGAAVASVRQ